jgi:hypothetical protein
MDYDEISDYKPLDLDEHPCTDCRYYDEDYEMCFSHERCIKDKEDYA